MDEPKSRVEVEAEYQREMEAIEPFSEQVRACERAILMRTIALCRGNQEEAAIRLGISRVTIWRKLGRK